jgi:hypothetical protein
MVAMVAVVVMTMMLMTTATTPMTTGNPSKQACPAGLDQTGSMYLRLQG